MSRNNVKDYLFFPSGKHRNKNKRPARGFLIQAVGLKGFDGKVFATFLILDVREGKTAFSVQCNGGWVVPLDVALHVKAAGVSGNRYGFIHDPRSHPVPAILRKHEYPLDIGQFLFGQWAEVDGAHVEMDASQHMPLRGYGTDAGKPPAITVGPVLGKGLA
jgi:hypothetical protein